MNDDWSSSAGKTEGIGLVPAYLSQEPNVTKIRANALFIAAPEQHGYDGRHTASNFTTPAKAGRVLMELDRIKVK